MELHAKTVRSQLNFFKPFVANCSLEVTRKGQDKLGELMTALHKREVMVKEHDFGRFQGAWIMPKDERRNGVVLYLHGGGYTCGSLEYAKGFGATLASEAGVRVFCAAYRLAPENRYPAALDDALESYNCTRIGLTNSWVDIRNSTPTMLRRSSNLRLGRYLPRCSNVQASTNARQRV